MLLLERLRLGPLRWPKYLHHLSRACRYSKLGCLTDDRREAVGGRRATALQTCFILFFDSRPGSVIKRLRVAQPRFSRAQLGPLG
eukprot:scaffold51528_cov39-Tisochrysis_lutea.AAC.2